MKDSIELHNVTTIEGKEFLTVDVEPDTVDFDIPEGYEFDDFELVLTIKFKKKKDWNKINSENAKRGIKTKGGLNYQTKG